jgi:hypothetical protein
MTARTRWKYVVTASAAGFVLSVVGYLWLLFSPLSVNAWITRHWIIAPSRAGGIALLSRTNEPVASVTFHGFPGTVLIVTTNVPPTAQTLRPDNARRMQWMPTMSGTWFDPPATTVTQSQTAAAPSPSSAEVALAETWKLPNSAAPVTPLAGPRQFMCFIPLWWLPALFGCMLFVSVRKFRRLQHMSLCRQCGYSLESLRMSVCPECGTTACR